MEEWLLSSYHAEGMRLGPHGCGDMGGPQKSTQKWGDWGGGGGEGEYQADGHFVFILPSLATCKLSLIYIIRSPITSESSQWIITFFLYKALS